jgi:hypothetical protein
VSLGGGSEVLNSVMKLKLVFLGTGLGSMKFVTVNIIFFYRNHLPYFLVIFIDF